MGALRRALARIFSFFRKPPLDADFEAEIAAHIEIATAENIERGLTPLEARRQARYGRCAVRFRQPAQPGPAWKSAFERGDGVLQIIAARRQHSREDRIGSVGSVRDPGPFFCAAMSAGDRKFYRAGSRPVSACGKHRMREPRTD